MSDGAEYSSTALRTSRPFVVTLHVPQNGDFAPVLRDEGPCRDRSGPPCVLGVHHLRPRKTGPLLCNERVVGAQRLDHMQAWEAVADIAAQANVCFADEPSGLEGALAKLCSRGWVALTASL